MRRVRQVGVGEGWAEDEALRQVQEHILLLQEVPIKTLEERARDAVPDEAGKGVEDKILKKLYVWFANK